MEWAIYCRLSRDDDKEKVGSLENQEQICRDYIESNNIGVVKKVYMDDDITGMKFEREGLEEMTAAVEKKEIDGVIVKDVSRLGRNQGKTIVYHDFLIDQQIRLICISDNYDTATDDDDTIGLKCFLNERFVKDISQKIRSSFYQKMKNGEWLGDPPLGYIKKNKKLYINYETKHIVEEIFRLYMNGWGYAKIANLFNQERKYPTPRKLKKHKNARDLWSKAMIKRILQNPVYKGDTAQSRRENANYKNQKLVDKDKSKWIIVENTHESIIPKEEWELVQEMMSKRKSTHYRGTKKKPSLFSYFLRCGKCGEKLYYKQKLKTDKNKRPPHYSCANYHKYGIIGCEAHYINENKLISLIIADIEVFYNNFQDEVMQRINMEEKDTTDLKEKIKKLEDKIEKNNNKLDVLYEDRLDGNISIEFFKRKEETIATENDTYREEIEKTRKEVQKVEEYKANKGKIKDSFQRIIEKKKLDREDLERCIDKIYVFLPEEIDKFQMEKLALTIGEYKKIKEEGGVVIKYAL